MAMLVAALYEIIPLDSGLSVGQGAVGGGGGLVLDIDNIVSTH